MKVTIRATGREAVVMELDADTTIESVKVLLEVELDIAMDRFILVKTDGTLLIDEATLEGSGLSGQVELRLGIDAPPSVATSGSAPSRSAHAPAGSSGAAAGSSAGANPDFSKLIQSLVASTAGQIGGGAGARRPQATGVPPAAVTQFRQRLLNNPYELSQYRVNHPDVADAVVQNDTAKIAEFLNRVHRLQKDREDELRSLERRAAANPMDVEVQRRIEELIQLENIERNRQDAIEYMPESFGTVIMLYINMRINGHAVRAFVDSGAQMTIMSSTCADRCGLSRFMDKRYSGMAVGVGQQRILGRIHMTDIEIAGAYLPTSFSVLEKQPMDVLLGLDMLKRHQCVLDLRRGVLVIGTTGAETPFLGESEIPRQERTETEEASKASSS